ncbi:winged helix-turn-helix domain-containing protein [Novosphingobium tardum]|uniref:Winged helix-turn-helix domain-containing protein n=1 Tax=Novosphingobium tardum TaxID=1538021 RepID=A0ABV8RTE6_9SPHN
MNDFANGSVQSEASAEEPVPLARRPDFRLGKALIRPSLRVIEGPAGTASAEPRVIQVLLALHDANSAVLSREDLLRVCWQGRIVGDDAINRAIAELRKAAAACDAGFTVETISRVGYRLSLDGGAPLSVPAEWEAPPSNPSGLSRRTAIAGAGALAATTLALTVFASHRSTARAAALVREGRRAYEAGTALSRKRAAELFERALAEDRANAAALGWLSIIQFDSLDTLPNAQRAAVAIESRRLMQRALDLDPSEPTARMARAMLERGIDDWIAFERQLDEILRDDPTLSPALNAAMLLFQGVGRCRDSLAINERALAAIPGSPTFQWRRAMKFWIFGRPADADRVIDSALEMWPTEIQVWNTRLTIYAFTGRPRAGLAMLTDEASRPRLRPEAVRAWNAGLEALSLPSAANVSAAEQACATAALIQPGMAANAVMILSALGALDAAYAVAEGFVAKRGNLIGPQSSSTNPMLYSARTWRGTQWLFTPATRRLRADGRFTPFCEQIGYIDYWRKRGIWPDKFVRGSLVVA